MSVHKVIITEAEEKYAPPGREIELAVVGDIVFLTSFKGSDDNIPSTKVKEFDFPPLKLHDLIAGLAAFGVSVQGILISTKEQNAS